MPQNLALQAHFPHVRHGSLRYSRTRVAYGRGQHLALLPCTAAHGRPPRCLYRMLLAGGGFTLLIDELFRLGTGRPPPFAYRRRRPLASAILSNQVKHTARWRLLPLRLSAMG